MVSIYAFFCVTNIQEGSIYERTNWEDILEREDVYMLDGINELESIPS